ncbi:hypothetical protein RHSIM_Rhsim13G0132100 [Rhododendron simsii]|uniref:SWIM-type domain-containing protein n=1 Tax=Rhododendron simsii TaxID=118357 RepID=A0A834FXR0_RHOSS|nr:hypothetical protein RHSIM_Rhsim13G0132100 [Rhododendron simsii]
MDVVSPLPSQMCQSSANSSQMPYIPQVKNDVIPKINQEFVSLEAVHKFYNNYGKEGGFGTREWSSRKNGDKVVVRKEYVCCKQGHWVPKKPVLNTGSSKRRRGIIREGCGAKLAVVRSKSGDKYVVSQFVEAHNHPLTSPRRTHLLRSHRKVTAAKRVLAEQLSQANVPTCQQMSIFEVQAGDHYDEFKQCIWNSESPEEFEAKWADVVQKANLSSNEWLKDMYEIRERWIPAYMKHIFSAHMTSSQRAEISHSFFKKYVSLNNSLYDFVTRFARGLAHIRHKELDLDHKDLNEKPQLSSSFPMESTMSELYTLAIFQKFQDEHYQIGGYMVKMTHEDEHNRFYIVERAKVSGARVRNLLVNKSSEHVSCSCKLFEFDGIPCRHLLAYFNRMQILDLPRELILARWTKAAKIKIVVNDVGGSVQQICDTSVFERRNKLFKLASSVIDDAVLTEDGSELLEDALSSVRDKLCAMNLGREGGNLSASVSQVPIPRQHIFKEPLQVRAKGCGQRLKGGKEKAVKKSRRCNGCGLTGQSHDKRNCPKLRNISSQDVRMSDEEEDDEDDEIDDQSKCLSYHLILLNESQIPIWSTNQNSAASSSVVAVLGDDDTKEYVILWNGSEQYWSSGSWNAQEQIFSWVPEMRLNYNYNFSYVDNENESYFTYSMYDPKIISRFVMMGVEWQGRGGKGWQGSVGESGKVRAEVDNQSGVQEVEETAIAHWNELQHMKSKHYLPLPMMDTS